MKGKIRKKSQAWLTDKSVKTNLPADYPWKVLGWVTTDLADYLTEDENDLVKQIVRSRDIPALNILQEMWGLQSFSKDSADNSTHISIMRAKYQMSALLKKFRFKGDKHMREAKALEKFFLAEAACTTFNHSGYKAFVFGETEHDAKVLTYARAYISKVLGDTSVPSNHIVTTWSRHGPGSNLDTLKGQSNLYDKYRNWPYSCTSSAIPYARYLIQSNKRWLGYLEDSYRTRENIPKHCILNQEVFWSSVFKVVQGNRITFVPKNAQTERSIAIEPAMNLMLQLGVDGYIRKRLKRWDVDLDSQEKNRRFAYRGSIDPSDESYVTLDLSAASDSISLKLCSSILPPDWYAYLVKIRSPHGLIGDDLPIVYEKISSMGNGYTFALESLIFASLCYGAIRSMDGAFNPKTDYCVFGDDIIVRRRHASKVIRALNLAGFQLNHDKSFVLGPVRESCGADWIHGKPVRPVFFDDIPQNVMSLFVDINRLRRLFSLRWGIEDSLTVKNMEKWVPEKFRYFTGPCSDTEFDSHLHSRSPTGHYANCLWKYPRLITKVIPKSGRNFFNRKLMHDLRGASSSFIKPLYLEKGKGKKITSGGSRFTVIWNHSSTVGRSFSVSSYWRSDYAEDTPVS